MKCKLEVVSGFLGSGKTSFINSYLTTDICKDENILVILLEKGSKDVIRSLDCIHIVYLRNSKYLKETILDKVKENNYIKLIIEFNGTYDLNIISTLINDREVSKVVKFYGNYYIGDASTLEIYLKNMGEILVPFIQSSKLIVLNNLNLVDKSKKSTLIKIIENINFTAPIIYSKSIDVLDSDLKSSSYFKKGLLSRKLSTLFKKGEK
ncbi:hypothetical protein UT300007_20020 [Clostridium sp. CTA-7]